MTSSNLWPKKNKILDEFNKQQYTIKFTTDKRAQDSDFLHNSIQCSERESEYTTPRNTTQADITIPQKPPTYMNIK
jgi:hypothetical protein